MAHDFSVMGSQRVSSHSNPAMALVPVLEQERKNAWTLERRAFQQPRQRGPSQAFSQASASRPYKGASSGSQTTGKEPFVPTRSCIREGHRPTPGE
ncbi:hypothetical protein D187_002163 [Cystobacter fuscus DSM 2262]|uniref:Uncharacterized protein n=1 Tax=Cystobacter fuscus (strain ATCC 25194 / DSM 2262 / NBRC 100088 / M29) TaxID=1242864 RepID=S9PCR8_CYSF2|nr:hypothetical protein D187_002163 [Cystobacter fuscus DSM 2262]